MFPTFEFLGKTIGMYGVMIVIGAGMCLLVCNSLRKKYNIKFDDLILVMVAIGIGAAIGGHIVYGITNFKVIIETFVHIKDLWAKNFFQLLGYAFGGMVFYGGFLGAIAAILIYTKHSKVLKRDEILDIFAVGVPLFHTFGRIGCFLGGCCYGVESKFGFTVHDNKLNPSINGVNRLPLQLIESFCNLLIFFVLLYLFKRCIMEKRLIFIYMLIYAPVRFVLEFWRGDTYRGFLFGLSTSQWISLLLVILAITMLIVYSKKKALPQKSEDEHPIE